MSNVVNRNNPEFEALVQEKMRQLKARMSANENREVPIQHPENNHEFEALVQEKMKKIKAERAEQERPVASLLSKDSLARLPRGMLETYGGMADLLNTGSRAFKENLADPLAKAIRPSIEGWNGGPLEPREEPRDTYPEEGLAKYLPKKFDEMYGKDLTPRTDREKFVHGTGNFLTPMGPLKAVKPALKPIIEAGKKVAAKVLGSAGASAAINLTPRLNEEGTVGGAVEDIVKGAVGSNPLPIAKKVGSVLRHPIETASNVTAKGLSKLMTPDRKILDLAEKHAIDAPFNVGADSHILDFTANNYLKSMFTSKKYHDALKRSDQSMIDAVRKSIDKLGEHNATPSAASQSFREQLASERKALQSESTGLYKEAKKSLKFETVKPKNLLRSINSESVTDLLENPLLNDETKKVVNRIIKIKDKFGAPNMIESLKSKYPGTSEHYIERAMRHVENKTEVPVRDLIKLRSYLLSSIDYNPEVYGIEKFLSNMARAVDKDIRSMRNKTALEKYLDANKFYYENIANRFKNSLASSILKGDGPTEAYNLMNSVQNVQQIAKIAGGDPRSLALFKSLKKAKAREIIGRAVEGDLKSDGTIRTKPFSDIFKKGEKRNELLEELLGRVEYDNLAEIAEISGVFAKHNRNLLNTSGTAHVASDLNASKKAVGEGLNLLGYVLGGAGYAGYNVAGPAGAVGAVAGLGSPYVISRLLANDNFVKKARSYARARAFGRERTANTILNRDLLPIVITANSKVKKRPKAHEELEEPEYDEYDDGID